MFFRQAIVNFVKSINKFVSWKRLQPLILLAVLVIPSVVVADNVHQTVSENEFASQQASHDEMLIEELMQTNDELTAEVAGLSKTVKNQNSEISDLEDENSSLEGEKAVLKASTEDNKKHDKKTFDDCKYVWWC